jgi:hypothetical protein
VVVILVLKKIKHYLYLVFRFSRKARSKAVRILKKVLKAFFPGIYKNLYRGRLLKEIKESYGYDFKNQKNSTKRIAIIAREVASHPKSSFFIRLLSPLTLIAERHKLAIDLYEEDSVRLKKGTSVAIVQRTAFNTEKTAKRFVKYVKRNGIHMIFDNDDDFRFINIYHPEYEQQKSRSDATEIVASAAEQVWLSTKELAESYADLMSKVVILPNSVDNRLWHHTGNLRKIKSESSAPLKAIYMGTATHGDDLSLLIDPMKRLHVLYPGQFSLTVIGVAKDIPDYPWLVRLYQPEGFSLYPRFVRWFLLQGPFDIGLAPLKDTQFNASKSDIKCLDYLAAGIIPLVSDVTAYRGKDIGRFIIRTDNNTSDWLRALEKLIIGRVELRDGRARKIETAQHYITLHRSTEHIAGIMYKQIKSNL